MRPCRGAVGAFALLILAAGASPIQAAWDNVFQVCCHHCEKHRPAVSAYYNAAPDPCCNPCPPQPCCQTQYRLRSYYQPVTCYQTKTFYEPVTTYRTSYYWEPVTSYRYSMYYDPSTCSWQQQACPQTCYKLRSQCCPVQSWVQRCATVPVTTQQLAYYYEPVTTCTTPGATAPIMPPASLGAPGIDEQRSPGGVPGVGENRSGGLYGPGAVPGTGSSLRLLSPQMPGASRPPVQTAPPPNVRLEKIAFTNQPGIEGQIVRSDRAPQSGARVLFSSLDHKGTQQVVTSDGKGQFRVSLASGGWLVYLYGADGKLVFDRKLEVRPDQASQVLLVSTH